MRRRLFTLLSALSLLVCGAITFARAKSLDEVTYLVFGKSHEKEYGIGSAGGFASFGRIDFVSPVNPKGVERLVLSWRRVNGGHGDVLSALGFDYYDEKLSTKNLMYVAGVRSFKLIAINYWTLIFVASVMPSIWLYQASRRKTLRRVRARVGNCPSCGYDLRATPGRCPECGTVPPIGKVKA